MRVEPGGEGVPGVAVASRHADDERDAFNESAADLGQHAAAFALEPAEAVDDEEIGLRLERALEQPRRHCNRRRIDATAARLRAQILHDRQGLAAHEIAHPDVVQVAEVVVGAFLHEARDADPPPGRAFDERGERRVRRFIAIEQDRREPARLPRHAALRRIRNRSTPPSALRLSSICPFSATQWGTSIADIGSVHSTISVAPGANLRSAFSVRSAGRGQFSPLRSSVTEPFGSMDIFAKGYRSARLIH